MDFLTRKVRNFFAAQDAKPRREITKLQSYLEFCYKVLSWEDVSLTLSAFLILNFVFWLVIQLQLQIFGVIFLLALVAFVADFYHGDDPLGLANDNVDTLDQLKADLQEILLFFTALRKDNPTSFLTVLSTVFITITLVSRSISGVVLSYFFLLGLFFIPLAVIKAPPQYAEAVKEFIRRMRSEKGVLSENELIPFIADKDFEDQDTDSILTDKTADSGPMSFLSGLTSMPSYLDCDDHGSLKEEDLIPEQHQRSILRTPDSSTDSDSERKGINFDTDHFEEESTSEEEFLLKRTDNPTTSQTSGKEVSTGAGAGLFAGMLNLISPSSRKDSSSDSEFEIINTDDVSKPY